ncbi:agmatinase [Roseivirga misakiensis]|uniref:Agmatinase n=1 Tax=Roseivirga misakiensis TaxID=1563681 RepID=A0A1E5SXV8_9BACT|nr:agmatinase [Roseivirga misakiensis]OEK03959.1 agmatinase [Roseivirga misakiensis]
MGIIKGSISNLASSDIALIGIPFDENSSYLRGPAEAPEFIIEAIESNSANFFTENLTNLHEHPKVKWCGNTSITDYLSIQKPIESILSKEAIPFSLGGDHSMTFPIMKAMAKKYPNLQIIQFDAHGDLYDELDGNKHSHACPFARIMESGLAKNLTQIGVRTMTQHQKEQADRFGVNVIEMKDWTSSIALNFNDPVYVTFDMDVLDPAFAPGVSHHEPGGLSTREAISMIQKLDANIVGCDVVEYNPTRDINGMTAMVAAKIVKELLAKLI